ncbi:MAG: GNAT family N-acetyltransferase [Lachnospiraceae bacterium]|nr:GNAT family N-acetyltransferase [Lachnospiraceae bacterium]
MIQTIGIFIQQYNIGESSKTVQTHFEALGLSCDFDESVFLKQFACSIHAFAITDDRETADHLKAAGIGFAVYDNDTSRLSSFPDALYIIDFVSILPLQQVDRMLLRFLRLPWTILETDRCLVREITEEDVDALYEIYHSSDFDFRYTEGLYDDPTKERDYTRDYIDYQYRFCEYGIWIVIDKLTGKIIGRAGLSNRDGYENAELGYGFASAFRHKGYAFEVCSAILTYAREQLGMSGLNAFTIRQNHDSVRLLKRLGFHFEDTAVLFGKEHDRYFIELSHR